MVHAVHRSIQVYQDFHRQTLSHLQKLEQNCYKLMPQFDQEQILGMVEQAHRMKAGARYLNLTGFEKLSFHVKGRYMALMDASLVIDQDFLKQLIQMKELFRLCLLSTVDTWQADLTSVVTKLPTVFNTLDQGLTVPVQFSQNFPTQSELENDIQRLLVAIVLIPELARLDMMLKNTPASKLSELLTSQLPRLQLLAQQLQLPEIQRSMQMSLLEIQARPSHAKAIGIQALSKWSDLANQTLTRQSSQTEHKFLDPSQTSFQQACIVDLEAILTEYSVILIEGNEDGIDQSLQTYTQLILDLAKSFKAEALERTSTTALNALKYHPEQGNLIGRLAVQDWLRHQMYGVIRDADLEKSPTSDLLLDLAIKPLNLDEVPISPPQDPVLTSLLSQVEMPDGFREFASEDEQSIVISRESLDHLRASLQLCQQEMATSPQITALQQTFQAVLEDYHQLVSLSLSEVFARLQPMVDALELQNGIAVTLEFSGDQIAIDRCQAEVVYELLVGLVSHAVVYGLEQTQERQRVGKSPHGKISICAYPQNDDVLIEVQDDGRGLNFEILREWVIRRYGLSLQEGNFLSESEILDFLFKGGSSTVESTSEASGLEGIQGILEQVNGSIEVATVLTQGTTFRVLVPKLIVSSLETLTDTQPSPLAPTKPYAAKRTIDYSLDSLRYQGQAGPTLELATQGLFVWADIMSICLLACDRIEEYVMPHVTEAHRGQQSLTWREQVIPIFSLQDFLGQSSSDEMSANEEMILVVKGEQQFLALRAPIHRLVDDSILTINPLSQALAAPRYIYGTTVLEQESPRLVVDVAALIAQQPLQSLLPVANKTVGPTAPTEEPSPSSTGGTQIMVVDDSRTAREIVSLTLRQGGYEVIHAKDGVDALEQLQKQQAAQSLVDLVISDVAMPRMNGLEFLRQCRQDSALQALPIAMLSNCDSTTHSDLALKEGANAYLTKPYQEDAFLAEIAKLLETEPQAALRS